MFKPNVIQVVDCNNHFVVIFYLGRHSDTEKSAQIEVTLWVVRQLIENTADNLQITRILHSPYLIQSSFTVIFPALNVSHIEHFWMQGSSLQVIITR